MANTNGEPNFYGVTITMATVDVGLDSELLIPDLTFASNIRGMVAVALKKAGSLPIRRLNIIDHGGPEAFRFGSDRVTGRNISTFEPFFAKLNGRFSYRGFIHLQHCKVGQQHGLLRRLARITGVSVYAGTGLNWPQFGFNAGDIVRANPDGSVTTVGYPGSDPYAAPIAPPAPLPPPVANKSNELAPWTVSKQGTMLSEVSMARYGTFHYWPLIWELNRTAIGSNPNKVPVGISLKILKEEAYTPKQKEDAKAQSPSWRNYPAG
jgi:hypothetical protein